MAKEKIYTIPVTDAYKEADDCPICYMYNKLVRDKIDFLLDTAYMEDDIRSETNRLGFCEKHYTMINKETNRLGIALILETHMKSVHQDLMKKTKSFIQTKKSLFGNKETQSSVNQFIQETLNKCYICETVDITFNMYLDTLIYLYKKDTVFKDLFEKTDFYCMKHYGLLYDLGIEKLKPAEQPPYLNTLNTTYQNAMDQILEDMDWFIKKFDYRYKEEPWKNARTAIPKALKHITSINSKES